MKEIRKSSDRDMDRIMEIYANARTFMAAHGNPNQWGPTNWPPEDLIKRDIESSRSYVCVNRDGKIIGTFFFDQGRDIEPAYKDIRDGSWLDDSPYGVVHRIAGDGSEKGIGSFCLNWAYEKCGHLRIDTHGDNVVMQNLLKKNGFIHCGTVHVEEDDYPRLAFEKSELTSAAGQNSKTLSGLTVIRATETWQQAGAYYVRIQAMAKKHHITLRQEFDEHDTPETKYIVVTEHDFPIATARLYPLDTDSMMIGRVVVLPEYRHQGIGTLVVQECEKWAGEAGFRKTVLESRDNKIDFYLQLNYKICGEAEDGGTFRCIRMEKRLPETAKVREVSEVENKVHIPGSIHHG